MTAAPRAPSGPTGYLKGEDEVQNDWRQLYGPHAVEIPGIPSHPTLIPTPNIEEAKRLVKDHGPGIAIKAINPALKPAYDVSKALYSAYGEYSRSGSLMNGVVEFETKLFFSKFAGDTTKAVTGNKILQVPVGVLVKELIKPIKAADKNSSTESIARGVREMVPNVGELITKR